MPTDRWSAFCALLVAALALAVGTLPAPAPFGLVFLTLASASVTLLAWIATDGRRPTLAVAGAMCLAFAAARGQADFIAGALAAGAAGFVLFKLRGRACAESSPR